MSEQYPHLKRCSVVRDCAVHQCNSTVITIPVPRELLEQIRDLAYLWDEEYIHDQVAELLK